MASSWGDSWGSAWGDSWGAVTGAGVTSQSGVSRLARSEQPSEAELQRRRAWVLNERKRIQSLNAEIAEAERQLAEKTAKAATAARKKVATKVLAENIAAAIEPGQITSTAELLAEELRRKKLTERAEAAIALMLAQAQELALLVEQRNADQVRMLEEEQALALFLDEEAAIAALMMVM